MNICAECKHCSGEHSWQCRHPEFCQPIDSVTGDPKPFHTKHPPCRQWNPLGTCDGFERKETVREQYDEWTETQRNAERYKETLVKIDRITVKHGVIHDIASKALEDDDGK